MIILPEIQPILYLSNTRIIVNRFDIMPKFSLNSGHRDYYREKITELNPKTEQDINISMKNNYRGGSFP